MPNTNYYPLIEFMDAGNSIRWSKIVIPSVTSTASPYSSIKAIAFNADHTKIAAAFEKQKALALKIALFSYWDGEMLQLITSDNNGKTADVDAIINGNSLLYLTNGNLMMTFTLDQRFAVAIFNNLLKAGSDPASKYIQRSDASSPTCGQADISVLDELGTGLYSWGSFMQATTCTTSLSHIHIDTGDVDWRLYTGKFKTLIGDAKLTIENSGPPPIKHILWSCGVTLESSTVGYRGYFARFPISANSLDKNNLDVQYYKCISIQMSTSISGWALLSDETTSLESLFKIEFIANKIKGNYYGLDFATNPYNLVFKGFPHAKSTETYIYYVGHLGLEPYQAYIHRVSLHTGLISEVSCVSEYNILIDNTIDLLSSTDSMFNFEKPLSNLVFLSIDIGVTNSTYLKLQDSLNPLRSTCGKPPSMEPSFGIVLFPDIYYTFGAIKSEIFSEFPLLSSGLSCLSLIKYSFTVNPIPENELAIVLLPSTKVFQYNPSLLLNKDYEITITGTMINSKTISKSFWLRKQYLCTDPDLQIVSPANLRTTFTYTITNSFIYYQIPGFSFSPKSPVNACTITLSVYLNPNRYQITGANSWEFVFQNSNQFFVRDNNDNSKVGIYTLTLNAQSSSGLAIKEEIITVTILHQCTKANIYEQQILQIRHDISIIPTVKDINWQTSINFICPVHHYELTYIGGAAVTPLTNLYSVTYNYVTKLWQITITENALSMAEQKPKFQLTGFVVINGVTMTQKSIEFEVVIVNCRNSYIGIPGYLNAPVDYIIKGNTPVDQQTIVYQPWTSPSVLCGEVQVSVYIKNAILLDFIKVEINPPTFGVYLQGNNIIISTNDLTLIDNNPYTIKLMGILSLDIDRIIEEQFVINFVNKCPSAVIGISKVNNYDYQFGNEQLTIQINKATTDADYPVCGIMTHDIVILDSRGQGTSLGVIFTLINDDLSNFLQLKVITTDTSLLSKSPYSITIYAYKSNYIYQRSQTKFQVALGCIVQYFKIHDSDNVINGVMSPQMFNIGSDKMIIEIPDFIQDYNCNYPVKYSIVNPSIPSYISIDVLNEPRTIDVYAKSRSDGLASKTTIINIKAVVQQPNSMNLESEFKVAITIIFQNVNQPQFDPSLNDILVTQDESVILNFPELKDLDIYDNPIISPGFPKFGSALVFITGVYPNYKISPTKLNSKENSYPVEIEVNDQNFDYPTILTYTFKIIVSKKVEKPTTTNTTSQGGTLSTQEPGQQTTTSEQVFNASQTRKKSGPKSNILEILPLKARIRSVNQFGVVRITFNQEIEVPQNYTNHYIQSLNVTYVQEAIVRNVTKFNVTSISETDLYIQMLFEEPLSISSGSDYDQMTIKFRTTYPIYSKQDMNNTLNAKEILKSTVPPQLPNGDFQKTFQSSAQATSTGIVVIISANVLLTVAGGFSMKKLWLLISTLQILVHYPLMKLPIPSNVLMLLQGIQDISNLNFIPKEQITNLLNNIVTDTSSSVNGSFVFLMLVLALILLLIILILSKLCKNSPKVQKIITNLKTKLMFNPLLQAQLKGYIKFNISALIALQNFAMLPWSSKIINVMIFLYLTVVPILFVILLWRFTPQQLSSLEYKAKYGSLYLNLKTNSKDALTFTGLYLYRRMILGLSVIFFSSAPLVQSFVAIWSSMGMLTFLLFVKPHRSLNTRIFEVYNEMTVLIVTYLLMMNIGYITDDQLKFDIGWVIVGIIGLCIMMNLGNVLINMFKKILKKILSILPKKRTPVHVLKASPSLKARKQKQKVIETSNPETYSQYVFQPKSQITWTTPEPPKPYKKSNILLSVHRHHRQLLQQQVLNNDNLKRQPQEEKQLQPTIELEPSNIEEAIDNELFQVQQTEQPSSVKIDNPIDKWYAEKIQELDQQNFEGKSADNHTQLNIESNIYNKNIQLGCEIENKNAKYIESKKQKLYPTLKKQ